MGGHKIGKGTTSVVPSLSNNQCGFQPLRFALSRHKTFSADVLIRAARNCQPLYTILIGQLHTKPWASSTHSAKKK